VARASDSSFRLLWRITDPQTRRPYLDPRIHPNGKFTGDVAKAVRAFQHDHHQKEDGSGSTQSVRCAVHPGTRRSRRRRRKSTRGRYMDELGEEGRRMNDDAAMSDDDSPIERDWGHALRRARRRW
jgi:hypothetical protein